jgi:hypothetical protein
MTIMTDDQCYNLLLQGTVATANSEILSTSGITDSTSLRDYAELHLPTAFFRHLKQFLPDIPARKILRHFGLLDDVLAAEAAAEGALFFLTSIPSLDLSPEIPSPSIMPLFLLISAP